MATVGVTPLSTALLIFFYGGFQSSRKEQGMVLVLEVGIGGEGSARGGFYSNLGKTWAVLDSRNVLLLLEGGGDINNS